MKKKLLIDINNLSLSFDLSFNKNLGVVKSFFNFLKNTKSDKFKAINNISVKLYSSEIIGVIGKNGCGKTTLLKTIAGIYSPDHGTVNTFGQLGSILSISSGFKSNLSGKDNIITGGYLMGLNKESIEKKLDYTIKFADLGKFINVPIKYYSSGMLSRLSFSISKMVDSDIMLIDEAVSVGDADFKKKSEKSLLGMKNKSKCIVLVSHDLELIKELCDKVIYMMNGSLYMFDKPEKVIKEYTQNNNSTIKKLVQKRKNNVY